MKTAPTETPRCDDKLVYIDGLVLRCDGPRGHRGNHASRNTAWVNLGRFVLPPPVRTAR